MFDWVFILTIADNMFNSFLGWSIFFGTCNLVFISALADTEIINKKDFFKEYKNKMKILILCSCIITFTGVITEFPDTLIEINKKRIEIQYTNPKTGELVRKINKLINKK